MSRGRAHRGARKKHAIPRDQRRPQPQQPKYGFWRSLRDTFTESEVLLIAAATLLAAGFFYVVLPPDGRLVFAAGLGIITAAVGYRVVRAIGWWRGDSDPTGGERGMFDWWNIDFADDDARRGSIAEALFGLCVYAVIVLAFMIPDADQAEQAIYVALVPVGISIVLWFTTGAYAWPRFLLPASYRLAARAPQPAVAPHSVRPSSRLGRKRRTGSRKGPR